MSYSKQTSIDIPSCPLGHGNLTLVKSWVIKGRGGKGFMNKQWKCEECGYSTRTYPRLKEETKDEGKEGNPETR